MKQNEEYIDNLINRFGLKKHDTKEQTVYKKTEKLLYNYLDFINIANYFDNNWQDFTDIKELDKHIALLNEALDSVMYDPFYEIIELVYFDKKTYEDVAEKLDIARVTISSNKQRLVNEIGKYIFTSDFINELYTEEIQKSIKEIQKKIDEIKQEKNQ